MRYAWEVNYENSTVLIIFSSRRTKYPLYFLSEVEFPLSQHPRKRPRSPGDVPLSSASTKFHCRYPTSFRVQGDNKMRDWDRETGVTSSLSGRRRFETDSNQVSASRRRYRGSVLETTLAYAKLRTRREQLTGVPNVSFTVVSQSRQLRYYQS
jgi:hypothetical protein